MARITGHVDYGNGAGPKAKAAPVVIPPPAPKKKPGRPIAEIPSPDEVYLWLMAIAERGERAPQLADIRLRWGGYGNDVVRSLVLADRIWIEVGTHNWRVIGFVGLKICTALPTEMKWHAYRRIDAQGSWWRIKGNWENRR